MKTIAIAIDARDVDVIISDISKVGYKPAEIQEKTPDNLYIIYYWDLVPWEGDAVGSIMKKLQGIRHAFCEIDPETCEIRKDILVSDSWGVDEEFYEILDISSEIRIWGDKPADKAAGSVKMAANIVWCCDDESDAESLPKQTILPNGIDEEDVADYLSDTYGFLVTSYCVAEPPFDLELAVPWAKYDISDKALEEIEQQEEEERISLKSVFFNEMLSDTDDEFLNIIRDYRSMDASARSVADALLVRLCGWSLPSLCKMAQEQAKQSEDFSRDDQEYALSQMLWHLSESDGVDVEKVFGIGDDPRTWSDNPEFTH